MLRDSKERAEPEALDQGALEFHFREHASLRAEIENDKQHLRRLETYALVGAGGIWSWLSVNKHPALQLGWCIPAVLGLIGLFQTMGVVRDIDIRAAYLRQIEQTVGRLGQLQGWENFLERRRTGDPSRLNRVFWGLYLLAAVAVPIVVYFWR
jgi:hypothetical protein